MSTGKYNAILLVLRIVLHLRTSLKCPFEVSAPFGLHSYYSGRVTSTKLPAQTFTSEKPKYVVRHAVVVALGNGLIVAEGSDHKVWLRSGSALAPAQSAVLFFFLTLF